jgi:ComF family protein
MGFLSWHPWFNVVLAGNCPLCQRVTTQLFCPDCQRQVQRCQVAAAEQWQRRQPPVFAWGSYRGALKRTIAALKYDSRPDLARPLATWLADAWLATPSLRSLRLTVVPIPLHPNKYQQRGFNQAELLAQHFCQQTRLSLAVNGLARSRETTAQFTLSAQERARNLDGAFRLGAGFQRQQPRYPVLLLDDIYTTGATANTAIATLRRHGISVYGIAVIARAKLDGM